MYFPPGVAFVCFCFLDVHLNTEIHMNIIPEKLLSLLKAIIGGRSNAGPISKSIDFCGGLVTCQRLKFDFVLPERIMVGKSETM